jgi:small nuclear ribonucleoprotein (snRNP)-like protein
VTWRVSRRALRRKLGRTVIVNLAGGDERAFHGVLSDVDDTHLALTDAELVSPRHDAIAGTVWVPLANVTWVQVLP